MKPIFGWLPRNSHEKNNYRLDCGRNRGLVSKSTRVDLIGARYAQIPCYVKKLDVGFLYCLEVKQNNDPTTCSKNMILEVEKTAKIKSPEIELRNLWTLSVTRMIEPERLNLLIDRYPHNKYYQTKARDKHVLLVPTEQTPFCCIVI